MNGYKQIFTLLAVLLMVSLSIACASGPKFSDVRDKDWNLIAVKTESENIVFDRNKLVEDGFSDIFTLRFDAERVNGVGAPNRYFAPYEQADKQAALAIKTVSQSQMAALREPEKLREYDYFSYLQNTTKWSIAGGNLELYSTGADGTETVLVFAPAGK